MSHINPSQQKLAEKLIILNDRSIGMLTRIYNIKKSSVQTINPIRQDIIKSLSLYYYTFVDLLELKDQISELLTIMDACQVTLDITVNTDLTSAYLNLVVNYASLLILLSRVEDRKAVLGLFNMAYSLEHESSDTSFPRLGQLILDYESPLRKLSQEFIPHGRLLMGGIESLGSVYLRRNLKAEQWRKVQLMSLVANQQQMLYAAQTETIPCEYLSLDTMDRWIILGLCLCHTQINQPQFNELWQRALEGNLTIRLFRDETIPIHQFIQNFFESIKGYNKRMSELKDYYTAALQSSALVHRERRKFLRSALRELNLILSDQPGLLGPKILFVFMSLSFARDEVAWLLRHAENWPQKNTGKGARNQEDMIDRQLPELLFYMEELRGLIYKYSQVIQRYYIQYLSGYDAIALSELLQNLPHVPEDESIILSSFASALGQMGVGMLTNEKQEVDFRGLRLDWCRLQAYTSVSRTSLPLSENKKLAQAMNTAVFHLKMVDFLDEMLQETSDLSLYCFYTKQLEHQFTLCLEFPSQTRYICAFPMITSHFMNSLHELCPEERAHIGEKSLTFCNLFLEEMSKEAKNIITNICDQQCILADKVLPKHCALLIREAVQQRKKSQKGSKYQSSMIQQTMPGDESHRKNREDMTMLDKLHIALTELCFSINHHSQIVVWEHTFSPREFLTQHLESRFNKAIVGMTMYNPQTNEIAKPSELLNSVRTYMQVFQTVESYVDVDVGRIFNNVLLQQTQITDVNGDDTITSLYTRWYLEVLLRRVSSSQILYSPHLESFISNPNYDGPVQFNPEEYTDFNELTSLAHLLGGYGIKFLSERLIWHVASQITELKKLVLQNKEVLRGLRSSFDKPAKMRELMRSLSSGGADSKGKQLDVIDNLLQRITIVGEILSFKHLLQQAIDHVLSRRIPFLHESAKDMHKNLPEEHPEQLAAFELCSAMGIECSVDSALVAAVRAQTQQGDISSEEDYLVCCLLMVFVAVSLPKLATKNASFFKATKAAHLNNSHCIARAVNVMAGALFTLHARGDTQDRMKEFLALASSSLLRLGSGQEAGSGGGGSGEHHHRGESARDVHHNLRIKESVYIILDQIVEESPWLSVDMLESCFPYILLRASFHNCYKIEDSPVAPL